ncbi:hypothetical protein [Gracilibacillus oryzae]|nr:hypothetical protein [Gracilibacillus oryzae]
MSNRELEKGLKNIIKGLEDLKKDQMKKENIKYWSPVKVMFTLSEQ